MTFPLYIINLSYLLESIAGYEEISVFNYLQLILSVLNFCVNPIKFVQKATLHDNKDFGIVEWLSTSLCFMPLVLIEIIHFFPFCFCYYVDGTLDWDDLVHILLLFNIPKVIFILHVFYLILNGIFGVSSVG